MKEDCGRYKANPQPKHQSYFIEAPYTMAGRCLFFREINPRGKWTMPEKEDEAPQTCHGCGGKGWVEVHEDSQRIDFGNSTLKWEQRKVREDSHEKE
jgi:hypothetical protein